jgi:hypothetical protein
MKTISIITFILLFFICSANAQDFTLAISYLSGEKSKDSHSTLENIAINGTSVAYSIKYSGRKGENQHDNNKTCTFTEQDILDIKAIIVKKGLNKTDSLFSESSKTIGYEVYTNISISMTLDGQEYKIKINGDTSELSDAKLYKSSLLLITRIRSKIENCK